MVMGTDATRRPPATATITYWMFRMNIVSGCMRLDMNCAPNDDSYSSSFVARNRCSTSRWRPNAFTTAWPVNVSSIWELSIPVLFHWEMNLGRDRPATARMPQIETGTVVTATTANTGQILNLITS